MEERFDYDGLLGVNSDLREQLADAQATVEALQAHQQLHDRIFERQKCLLAHYVTTIREAVRRLCNSTHSAEQPEPYESRTPVIAAFLEEALGVNAEEVEKERIKLTQQVEALQARVQELEARQHFGACAKCLTNAWRICKEGTPDAVEMKCSSGSTWWLCDYCLLKEQLTQRMTDVEALQRERDHAQKMEAVQKEVADNQTWHVRELRAALDAEREKVKGLEQQLTIGQRNLHDNNVDHRRLLDKYTQLQALVRKFVDSIQPVDCVEVDELLREARATLDATTPVLNEEDREWMDAPMGPLKGGDGE